MDLASRNRDQEIGIAFFELLLATPVRFASDEQGTPRLLQLDGERFALPVFLDEDSLKRWEADAIGRECTLCGAAQLALESPDTWLIVDPGSQPGNQAVGRPSVELLAHGTHPLAAPAGERHALVRDLVAAARVGRFDPAFADRAQGTLVVTLAPDAVGAPGAPLEIATVPGADGSAQVPVWPTMSGSFVFQPKPARRVVIPLGRLIDTAIAKDCGLLVHSDSEPFAILKGTLASLWKPVGGQ